MVTKSSAGIGFKFNCFMAKWNEATLIQAICLGLTAMRSRKRSTKLMAENRTSEGSSYQILRQRKT